MPPAKWELLEEMGYVRRGVVLTEAEIDRLCQRIDQIMWGPLPRDENTALSFRLRLGEDEQIFTTT